MDTPSSLPRRRTGATRTGLVLCAVGAALGLGTCNLAAPGAVDPAASLGIASLGLELFLTCLALGIALRSAAPLRMRLGLGRGRLPASAVALTTVGTLGLSQALDGVLALLNLRETSSLASFDAALAGASGWPLAFALVGVGLAPGIGEEILCRGLVQRGLQPRVGPAFAVGIGALVFGVLHLEPVHAVFASALGLYLGLIALLAGSTRPAILAHAVNNVAAVLAAARFPDLIPPSVGAVAAGLAVAAACLLAARRALPAPVVPLPSAQDLQPPPRPDEQ